MAEKEVNNSGEFWTHKKDALIYPKGKVSDKELSLIIGKSPEAIRKRRDRIRRKFIRDIREKIELIMFDGFRTVVMMETRGRSEDVICDDFIKSFKLSVSFNKKEGAFNIKVSTKYHYLLDRILDTVRVAINQFSQDLKSFKGK